MSKLIGADLEFRGGAQLINGRAHNALAHPPNPRPGQFYFNTTLNRQLYFDATQWVDAIDLITSGRPRRYQFFPPASDLSLTITEEPATLPADNNSITIHANGVRLFPDQGQTALDWQRFPDDPATITLRQRDGEWIMVEW